MRSDKSAKNIASDIMRLGLQMKTDINDVMISGITPRGHKLNAKAMEVNKNVQAECERYNLFFIDNTNIVANKLISPCPVRPKVRSERVSFTLS